MEKQKMTKTVVASLIIGLIIGFFVGYLLYKPKNSSGLLGLDSSTKYGNESGVSKESGDSMMSGDKAFSNGGDRIAVDDQPAGASVTVAEIVVDSPSWIAVREEKTGGTPGNILGAGRFDSGSYSGNVISLLRQTITGERYSLVIYRDNGDKVFDVKADTLVTDSLGETISSTYTAQ